MFDKNKYSLEEQEKFKIGDRVRVVRIAEDYENDWETVWVDLMNETVGKEYIVGNMEDYYGILLVQEKYFDPNDEHLDGFWYPYFVLEKVGASSKAITKENYPHICPYCGEPAWNGGLFECSSYKCPTKE